MSSHPVRVAFCPLLFAHNGGEFENGKPVFKSTRQAFVRGRCDAAHDCGECELLITWASKQQKDYIIGWECAECLRETKSVLRWLPGFYQSSRYRETTEGRVSVESERPLDGCTRCGRGSSFLQIVLRRPP